MQKTLLNEFIDKLVSTLRVNEKILGIGQTGQNVNRQDCDVSDVDLFILCSSIPTREERIGMYENLSEKHNGLNMQVCEGGRWGTGDIFSVSGIDVMPMYFSIEEMKKYVGEVLDGKHLTKEGGFYPVGRLASIKSIAVLYEKNNSWTDIVETVSNPPADFFGKIYEHEIFQVINEEDLRRAEHRREVLFYHQVLEDALDHFLQALFAKNLTYFPCRKRMQEAVEGFEIKPRDCYHRLCKIIEHGSCMDTIEKSTKELRNLVEELKDEE